MALVKGRRNCNAIVTLLKFGLEFAAVKDESVTLREKKARFGQSLNSEPCMPEVRADTQARKWGDEPR